ARGIERHVDARDAHRRVSRGMLVEHHSVVHLVDVIAREDQNVARRVPPQDIDVLIDGVRGSLIPARDDALLRGQQLDELVEAAVEKAPPTLYVTNQALRLVLRADADAPNPGIDA